MVRYPMIINNDGDQRLEFSASKPALIISRILCLAGLLVALYLAWLHYQVHTNPSFHSFCAMSDAFNCETVAESPYSVFLEVPVAVWGVLGYLVLFLLAHFGVGKHRLAGAYLILLSATFFSVLISVALAVVSYCIICSFCIMCSVTYGINVMLLVTLLWDAVKHRFPLQRALGASLVLVREHWKSLLVPAGAALLVCFAYPDYWNHSESSSNNQLQQGTTPDGHHWIGTAKPVLVVTEFSDYLCPHCRRAHALQRALVTANPDKLRLIHRHFPLDDACNPLIKSPFHPGACALARAAVCAGKQQRFWEMNDLLYSSSELKGADWAAKAEDAARRAGLNLTAFKACYSSGEGQKEIDSDIAEGLRLELQGTPSFVVDGQVHLGMVDPEVFQKHELIR